MAKNRLQPINQVKPLPPPAPPPIAYAQTTTVLVPKPERDWTEVDEMGYRIHLANKQRLDKPVRATPTWAANELLYWATVNDPRNSYYVVVALPLAGEIVATSARAGRRAVRLLYEWATIAESLALPPTQLTNGVLASMARDGGILRAGIAYAATYGDK